MTDDANAWCELQGVLHEGLSTFLNGRALTRSSYLLYPWIDRLDARVWTSWKRRAQRCLRQVGTDPDVADWVSIPESGSSVRPPSIAHCLAHLGAWLHTHLPAHLAEPHESSFPSLKLFDCDEYAHGGAFLEPVLTLQRFAAAHLSDLAVGVYLHGSMSTLDYVAGSSDLDVLVVVRQATVCAVDKLLLLRHYLLHTLRWFYRIDYSQHHGYAVLSELDLRFYAEVLFPGVLLQYLTPLTGASSLTVRYRCEQGDLAAACRNTAAYVRELSAASENLAGWFAMKLYLQSILLLPTLYLQAKGIHVYKRDSFALARPLFSDDAWRFVDKASQIRSLGPQGALLTPGLDRFLARFPSPWLASLVHRKLRNRIPEQVCAVLGSNWQIEALRFVDEVESGLTHED